MTEKGGMTTIGKIFQNIQENSFIKARFTRLEFAIPMLVYGVLFILLLRFSQIMLGWSF